MTTIRLHLSTLLVCVCAFSTAAAAQDQVLAMQDVSPALARLIGGTSLDYVAKAEIEYGVTGKTAYDRFYKSSAICYGGLVVAQGVLEAATLHLKDFAVNKKSIASLTESIAQITKGEDPETWDVDTSVAVLILAQQQGELSSLERESIVKMAANIAATIPVIQASVESAKELVEEASGLVSGARSAFGLRGAGGAARNVQRSADRISDVPTEGVRLAESLTVLVTSFGKVEGG